MLGSFDDRYTMVCEALNLNLTNGFIYKPQLLDIYDHLILVIGNDKAQIRNWMHRPKIKLKGGLPRDYLFSMRHLNQLQQILIKDMEMNSVIG